MAGSVDDSVLPQPLAHDEVACVESVRPGGRNGACKHTSMTRLTIGSLLLLAGTAAAQQTLIVDAAAGPDHDFTSLAPAVAAANSGDTILVRAGTYGEPYIETSKGLSIVGQGNVNMTLSPQSGLQSDGMTIRDLSADEAFLIRGIDFDGSFFFPLIRGVDCAGAVSVQSATGVLGSLGIPEAIGVAFDNCDRGHVHDCFVRNGSVSFTNSRGSVTFCALEGEITGPVGLENSDVFFDRCTITAGQGSPFILGQPMSVTGGTVRLARTSVAAISTFVDAPAIFASSDATIVLDPTATVSSAGTAPPIDGGPTVLNEELTTLVVRAQTNSLNLDLQSRTGAIFVTLLSFPSPLLPLPWGDLWVNPDAHLILHSGVLAQRVEVLALTTTGLPVGLQAMVQTVTFDGDFGLSNGCAVVFP